MQHLGNSQGIFNRQLFSKRGGTIGRAKEKHPLDDLEVTANTLALKAFLKNCCILSNIWINSPYSPHPFHRLIWYMNPKAEILSLRGRGTPQQPTLGKHANCSYTESSPGRGSPQHELTGPWGESSYTYKITSNFRSVHLTNPSYIWSFLLTVDGNFN